MSQTLHFVFCDNGDAAIIPLAEALCTGVEDSLRPSLFSSVERLDVTKSVSMQLRKMTILPLFFLPFSAAAAASKRIFVMLVNPLLSGAIVFGSIWSSRGGTHTFATSILAGPTFGDTTFRLAAAVAIVASECNGDETCSGLG